MSNERGLMWKRGMGGGHNKRNGCSEVTTCQRMKEMNEEMGRCGKREQSKHM